MLFTGVAYIMLYFSMCCGSPLSCIHMQRSETFQRRIDTSVNNIENCRNRSKDHRRVRNQSIPGSGSRQHWALTTVDPSSGRPGYWQSRWQILLPDDNLVNVFCAASRTHDSGPNSRSRTSWWIGSRFTGRNVRSLRGLLTGKHKHNSKLAAVHLLMQTDTAASENKNGTCWMEDHVSSACSCRAASTLSSCVALKAHASLTSTSFCGVCLG